MTLSPNTQISQENVELLKAGHVVRHKPTGWLMPFVRSGPFGITCIKPSSGEEYDALASNLTYIGPDLGDGWIGWSGGENPVPGVDVEVRLDASQPEEFGGRSDSYEWEWYCDGEGGDIIAFRPALSPPAEGVDLLRYAQQLAIAAAKRVGCIPEWRPLGDVYGCLTQIDNCLTGLSATPTPAPVDWTVVGPKLVEALEAFMPSAEVAFLWSKETPPQAEVQRYRERYWSVKAALAAAQPEGK